MLLPLLAAITLTVGSATSSAVTLTWTGASGAVTVERKAAGAPWGPAAPTTPCASITTATCTDAAIDAYATYTYRVKAGALLSNEVTVGPPPVGMSQVARMPAALLSTNTGSFAAHTRMTFDANGDPLIAYTVTDPNGDGEKADGQLFTVRWNRARYRWDESVKVADIGAAPGEGSNIPFSIARDAASGLFGVLFVTGTAHELRFATSPDAAAWTTSAVVRTTRENEDPAMASPGLALAGGTVHAAYTVGMDSVVYATGAETAAPAQWRTTVAPHPTGTKRVTMSCVGVVVDAAGAPGVSFCAPPEDGYTTSAWFWRVGGSASRIMDTDNHQTDDPSLAVAQRGTTVAAVFGAARDDRFYADHHFWASISRDGGASWGAPAVMADDGGNAMASPATVVVHAAGRFSAAAPVGGGNEGAVKCGQPKLMRTDTGTAWTTCAPDTRGLPGTANAGAPVLGVAGNDRLYLAFRTTGAVAGLAPGVVLWRER